MRPLRLEIEGFGTFRDRTVVDFSDLDLVAFVGPTGSGKSTVIDAITFALYGSVSRYDNPKLVAPVVHQLSAEAKVRFDFELAGTGYTAVRVVRRTKSKAGAGPRATTREARLERNPDGPGGDSEVLAGNVSELDEQVRQLIGLDFSQFTRTIVLPQGEFAEFLKDDPGNRQKLLRRLLDIDIYARMGKRARETASKAATEVGVYETEIDKLASVSPEGLSAAETTVAALDVFAAAANEHLDRLAAIETELTQRRDEVNRIDAETVLLERVLVPEGLTEIDTRTLVAREHLSEAEQVLDDGRQRRDAGAAELQELGDPSAIRSQLEVHRRLAEASSALDGVEAELDQARSEVGGCETDLVERQSGLDAANELARQARAGADAATWVARLREGESCPICQQTVTDLPAHLGHDEVAAIEQQAVDAQQAHATATMALAKVQGRVQSLESDQAQHHKAKNDLLDSVGHLDDADVLAARLEAATALAERSRIVAEEVRAAEQTVASARSDLAEAEAAEGIFRVEFTSQRDAVAIQKPPGPRDGETLVENWRRLEAWAVERRSVLEAERQEIAVAGKSLAGDKASVIGELAAGVEPFGLSPDPAGLLGDLAAAKARAEADVEQTRDALKRKTELQATIAELTETRVVHEALGQHLAATGFERWLLTEALDDIVARATMRLFELSDGRYSLEADDGSFNVCDHGNADERRDVRTLSGGEIFLASLSLALALAESIAELAPVDSPRLESIFLDEGFGTLDGETLDVLASAIEELSATGRLVAIVTHVRDLAERMPVRFEVRKGSTTSSIERSES